MNARVDRVKDQLEEEAINRLRNPVDKEIIRDQKMREIQKAKIGSLGYFEVFPYQ